MTDRDYSDYHRGPPDPPEHPPIRRRPSHFDRSDTLLSSGLSLADYERVKNACNEHGNALQRIASALDLMPGANVHTDCVPAIERLLEEAALLRRVASALHYPEEGQAWCYLIDEDTHERLRALTHNVGGNRLAPKQEQR